ncbi:MAG: carotenoid 1,2-hydratase [Pseudomonadota bacterium]
MSDCGQFSLSIIAFVGSVFSPYYAWARRKGSPSADNHCALNVALYSRKAKRWSMTERGERHCSRSRSEFTVGPSQLRWDGQALTIDINEVAVPFLQPLRGRITVHPQGLFNFSTPLDAHGLHRWGPLAPHARVEVDLQQPAQRWKGHAYLDSNEGDEPVSQGFREWDWSRCQLRDGSCAVIYDVEPDAAGDRTGRVGRPGQVLALRFRPDGRVESFMPPPMRPLAKSKWQLARRLRSDVEPEVVQQLEDTPFYQRAVLRSAILGEEVTSFHETLNVPRLVSPLVQAMLPWRMPRRG